MAEDGIAALRALGVRLPDDPPSDEPLLVGDAKAQTFKPAADAFARAQKGATFAVPVEPPGNVLVAVTQPKNEAERHVVNQHRMKTGLRPLQPERPKTAFELSYGSGYREIYDPATGDVAAYERSVTGYTERRDRDGKRIASSEIPVEGNLWYDPVYLVPELLPGGAVPTLLGSAATRVGARIASRRSAALVAAAREAPYRLVESENVWEPAVRVVVDHAHDHNGAIYVKNAAGLVTSELREFELPASRLVFKDGEPALQRTIVIDTHASPSGFSGVKNDVAAELVVQAMRSARTLGKDVDSVVLYACGQRDARFVLGKSNAQHFQALLDERLGKGVVTVLASEKPGTVMVGGFAKEGGEVVPVAFTPASTGAKLTSQSVKNTAEVAMVVGSVIGLGASTYGIFKLQR